MAGPLRERGVVSFEKVEPGAQALITEAELRVCAHSASGEPWLVF